MAVTVVSAALTGGALPVFLVSALSPNITMDLSLNPTALGTAVSAFFLASAVASVPGGRMADRFGARRALRGGLAIIAVCGLAVATLAANAWSLTALLFLGGTSLGLIDTGGARAISARVRVQRQGLAFGAKEASIPASSLLAGVSVPVLGAQFGWRSAFFLAAGFAVLVALLVPRRLELPHSQENDRVVVDNETGAPQEIDDAHQADAPHHADRPQQIDEGQQVDAPHRTDPPHEADALRRQAGPLAHDIALLPDDGQPSGSSLALVALAFAAGLGGGAAASAATFLVPSAVELGFNASAAGLLLGMASAVGISVRLSVGVLADRWLGAELRIVASLLALGSVGVLLLTSEMHSVVIAAAILAIGSGWGWTGLVFLAAVRIDPGRPARAAGIVLAGLGTGGAAGPAIFGLIADTASYATAWSSAGIAMIAAATSVVIAYKLRQRSQAQLAPR